MITIGYQSDGVLVNDFTVEETYKSLLESIAMIKNGLNTDCVFKYSNILMINRIRLGVIEGDINWEGIQFSNGTGVVFPINKFGVIQGNFKWSKDSDYSWKIIKIAMEMQE